MLPTLLFILGVYSAYALYTLWSRYGRRRSASARPGPRPTRLLLGGGVVAILSLLWLTTRFAPPTSHKVVHLGGILGGTEVEGATARADLVPEKPPVANAASGGHPAYALLHPETPPMLVPEKSGSPPAPPRKPKVKQKVASEGHKGGVSAKLTAKEKPAAKVKAKVIKKKRSPNTKPNLIHQAYSAVIQ